MPWEDSVSVTGGRVMLFVMFASVGVEEERIIFKKSITEVVTGGSVMVTRRVDLPYPVKPAVTVSQVRDNYHAFIILVIEVYMNGR